MPPARYAATLGLLALLLVHPLGAHAENPLEPAITPSAEVGTLAANFAVDHAGSAHYSIPLQIPAGTAGMAPTLAFGLASGGGNGELGIGGSLSGQSSLARCPTNLVLDGFIAPIEFSDRDGLCLDGERLVLVEGDPWKPESVYAKRRDDLTRIRLITATTCVGEIAFEVRSADSKIHNYGCGDDAVVFGPRGIFRWALARSRDRFGNYIDYDYAVDDTEVWSAEGQFEGVARVAHRLVRIRYTGHVAEPVLAPDRTIELEWEDRPDVQRGWFAGAPQAQVLRLREVSAFADGKLVRRWPLTYAQSEATGRSRVVAITECAADDACKPPTTFEWIEGELAMDAVPAKEWSADGGQMPYLDGVNGDKAEKLYQVTLDANGDGMSDVLAVVGAPAMPPPEARGWELWRSQPEAIVGPAVCGGNPGEPECPPGHYAVDEFPRSEPTPVAFYQVEGRTHSMFAIDADGDGRDDAVAPANHYMTWLNKGEYWAIDNLLIGHGTLEESKVAFGDETSPVFSYLAADFTGDGLGDLLGCQSTGVEELDLEIGTWRIIANQPGTGFVDAVAIDTGLRCSSFDKLLLLDHDGDGVASPLVVATWSDDTQSAIPSAKWTDYRALVFPPTLDSFAWVETGLPPDRAQRWRWSPTNYLNDMGIDEDFPRYGASLGMDRVLDVQGDGLPDIVRYQLLAGDGGQGSEPMATILAQIFSLDPDDEQGGLRLWINDGQRFRDGGWLSLGPPGRERFEEFASSATIDWNGDGLLDLLMPSSDTDTWDVWVARGDGGLDRTPLPGSPHWDSSGSAHSGTFAAMDVDGDGLHDPVFWEFGGFWSIFRHRGEQPDRIAAIVDGLGQRIEIEYRSITDYELPDLHEVGNCSWPANCAERAKIVVERHRLDTGTSGTNFREFVHRYAGSRSDRLERRWLGFQRHEVTEWAGSELEPIARRTTWLDNATYDETFATHPYATLPTTVLDQLRDPVTGERHVSIHTTGYEQIPTSTASFRVVENTSRDRSWQFTGGCFATFCEVAELDAVEPLTDEFRVVDSFDDLGFAVDERTFVELGTGFDGVEVHREIDHDLDPSAWLIGLVTHETTTHSFADDPLTRTTSQVHDPLTGVVVLAVDEPNQPELRLSTEFEHDAFGNITSTTRFDAFGDSRTDALAFDPRGRFPIRLINALGHTTHMTWNSGLSLPHTATDPNAIRHVIDVDGFGRLTGARVIAGGVARGDDLTVEYLPPELGSEGLVIRSRVAGQGQRTLVHDRLGRPIVERWRGRDGFERWQSTHYDLFGRVDSVSLPALVLGGGGPQAVDTWTWDLSGRPVMHTRADGAFERWFYQGRIVEHRDFAGETTRSHHDGAGRLIETERAPATPDHERLCFDYGAFSTLVQVRPDCVAPNADALAPPGEAPPTIKRFEYDGLGRLIWTDDPSTGGRSMVWNAFDELLETLDANDQLVEYELDALGRTITRIDDDGPTTWVWDTVKIGTITSASTPSGIVDTYQHDAFTRPLELTQTIAGDPLTLRFDYDGLNRIAAIHYPPAANLPGFGVRNLYGQDGSLVAVRKLADNAPIWQIDEVDAADRITRESFANGLTTIRTWDPASGDLLGLHTSGPALLQDLRYTWNPVGTLAGREDLRQPQQEQFAYDALHRLAHVHTQRGAVSHDRHFAYDPLGNLVYATDVGDYDYDSRGRLLIAGSTSHTWDDVGNLIGRTTPEGEQQFTWTSFNKLRRLIPAQAAPTVFEYDAEQHRAVRHDLDARLETRYLLGFYERDRQTSDEGVTETHRYHIQGRDRVVAEFSVVLDPANTVAQQTRTLHDDHLGSIDLVTGEQGQPLQRQSFDAWGKPRAPNDWTLPDEFAAPLLVNHGYTGHEARRDAGLVNMGGRLYDPRLGRMANADPYVVAPDVTLGWNRYAYVLDDPLSLTDPSGYAPAELEYPGDSEPEMRLDEATGEHYVYPNAVYTVTAQAGPGIGEPRKFDGDSGSTNASTSGTSAGGPGDSGPSADPRGDESMTRDIGLGMFDGLGNVGYVIGGGMLAFSAPTVAIAALVGYAVTGGNPISAARQSLGEMLGNDTLSADPTSTSYTASLLMSELLAGGITGIAHGGGSGLRIAASQSAASCSRSCGPAAGGLGARLIDLLSRTACFVEGTPIAMADGTTQPIESVREGQRVACVDEHGSTNCTVGATTRRRVSSVLDLEILADDGETATLSVTPEHPFYVAEFDRFVDADDLEKGTTLMLLDGRTAEVVGARRRTGEFEVYNFEAEGAHDYFAGPVFVLVHNACSSKLARAIEAATGVARPANHAAHHITATWAVRAGPARKVLKKFGIDIDDAVNGVYLPQNALGRVGSTAAYHPKVHTKKYYRAVNDKLAVATSRSDAEEILSQLSAELQAGTFPF